MFHLTLNLAKRKIRELSKIHWRGELAITAGAFGATALLRLISSIILTRLLYPEVYGIVSMILSVFYVIELMADIGIIPFLIRHHDATNPDLLNTVWTVRLARGVINAAAMILIAPWVAEWFRTPQLELALQIVSITFIIKSAESMSFLLAIRNQNSRIVTISELWGAFATTIFTIAFSYFSRDQFGILFGMVFNRVVVLIISYSRSDRIWPKICLEKKTYKEILSFARFSGPSSLLTIFITQYDKTLLLKLFDLKVLGLYGVAAGMAGPMGSLISQICHNILYPRIAQYLREDSATAVTRFYKSNSKVFLLVLLMPAIVGGLATPLVKILFDHRYADAAAIAQALCLAELMSAFASFSENVLIAYGRPQSILIGNAIRVVWILPASYIGYKVAGYTGFIFSMSLMSLPVTLYFWYQRHLLKLLILKNEIAMASFAAFAWLLSWSAGMLLLKLIP